MPSWNAAPRLTTSQQATPIAADAGSGRYCHFIGAPGFVRSSAYRMLGYGVTMYIVLATTRGAASCPRSIPVENVHASDSDRTFSVVICEIGRASCRERG